jgi:two-component system LytT family response regulator
MQLKCVAIDDEPLALELIQEYISRFPQLKLLHSFDDAISAVELLRNTKVDLLFIDINMPDITGIDLVRSLQEKPLIIFTTAHKQFAIEGFELDAVDYLLKPINIDRLPGQYIRQSIIINIRTHQPMMITTAYLYIQNTSWLKYS